MTTVADAIRIVSGVGSFALVIACVYACFRPIPYDQIARFAALALLGVAIVGGQIDALGRPLNWRLPVVAIGVALAVYGTASFLVKEHRRDHAEDAGR